MISYIDADNLCALFPNFMLGRHVHPIVMTPTPPQFLHKVR